MELVAKSGVHFWLPRLLFASKHTAKLHSFRLNPIFNLQSFNTDKFPLVVGNQYPAFRTGMGCKPKVVVADDMPATLKGCADLAVVFSGGLRERGNLDQRFKLIEASARSRDWLFSAPKRSSPSVMTDIASSEAACRAKRSRTAGGLCLAMDADVGVQQVAHRHQSASLS
jgi:hypothetical protein